MITKKWSKLNEKLKDCCSNESVSKNKNNELNQIREKTEENIITRGRTEKKIFGYLNMD